MMLMDARLKHAGMTRLTLVRLIVSRRSRVSLAGTFLYSHVLLVGGCPPTLAPLKGPMGCTLGQVWVDTELHRQGTRALQVCFLASG